MRYRRADVVEGTYFFTVDLAERKRTLLVDHINLLGTTMRKVKTMHPFHIDFMVILPDHLHARRTLPLGDSDHAARRKERGICDPRYWEHRIPDERAPA